MNVKDLNDNALLELLVEGKKYAFEEIYRRYWKKLFVIAFNQTGIKEEAEELVQEVFLSLWNRRTVVSIRNLGMYLTISIKNQVYDFIKSQISYRKYQEYVFFHEIYQNRATEEVFNYVELTEAVERVLGLLPEKSADVFKRSRFENQSVREIANDLSLSEKAVEYHITKSLKFLKQNLLAFQSNN
tara:strand:+ start:266 stop:823 length:558 start_codon:yes stop_codon:yes gene_type:complete